MITAHEALRACDVVITPQQALLLRASHPDSGIKPAVWEAIGERAPYGRFVTVPQGYMTTGGASLLSDIGYLVEIGSVWEAGETSWYWEISW